MNRHRWLRHHWNLAAGLVILGLLLGSAGLSFLYVPHDPNRTNIADRFAPPSDRYLLGTDQYGRDLLSRMVVGSRTAIRVGVVAVAIGLGIGLLVGGMAAYSGGWIDEILMRIMDAVAAYPPLLLAILFASILGPGDISGMLAIGVATVPVFARLTRASFLALVESEFVQAARAAGAGTARVICRHLLPNGAAVLLVQATTTFANALLAEAALSYLGLGTQPPHPSWGRMLREAQDFLIFSPYPAVFPGLAIAVTVLGLNLLGDGLRDVLDPKTRSSAARRV
ncbi:MAG: ABC transporter permease [Firmicutes bacterium]|nr:ABC transporter permease [Bacillota bacterium]